MQKSSGSGSDSAVDAFMDCVARCLAQRWLERQRGDLQGGHLSNESVTPTSVDRQTNSKAKTGPIRSRSDQ
jgi:hypothetical protein